MKRYSENMQQIYRTPMLACDFSNFIEIALRHGCSSVNLMYIFRTSFPKNTSRRLLLYRIQGRFQCLLCGVWTVKEHKKKRLVSFRYWHVLKNRTKCNEKDRGNYKRFRKMWSPKITKTAFQETYNEILVTDFQETISNKFQAANIRALKLIASWCFHYLFCVTSTC